jgi:hypothetical protein
MTTRQQLDHETLAALIERLHTLGVIDDADRDALLGAGRDDLDRLREVRGEFRSGRGPPAWAGPDEGGPPAQRGGPS